MEKRNPPPQSCVLSVYIQSDPTDALTILESRDQEVGEFRLVQVRRAADFEAPKL